MVFLSININNIQSVEGSYLKTDVLLGVLLLDAGAGAGLVTQVGPPAIQVTREGAGADHAEVVTFS